MTLWLVVLTATDYGKTFGLVTKAIPGSLGTQATLLFFARAGIVRKRIRH